jgi:hypothetical protein
LILVRRLRDIVTRTVRAISLLDGAPMGNETPTVLDRRIGPFRIPRRIPFDQELLRAPEGEVFGR